MKYELMVILDPKLTDKEIESTLGEIKAHYSEHNYKLVDEDVWGKRDFAYKIKNHHSGYYVVMLLEGEHAGSVELHKELRLQPGLMRYLLMKVPDDYAIVRYSQEKSAASVRTLNKHAEELSKKVTAKKPVTKAAKAEKPEAAAKPEDNKKLDEQLKAIIDDTDIDL